MPVGCMVDETFLVSLKIDCSGASLQSPDLGKSVKRTPHQFISNELLRAICLVQ